MRYCSKPGCPGHAVGTLTYDYQNSTAVLGPLATTAEPHSYDLCERHVTQLTVPKGWDVVRLEINYDEAAPSDDDLMALVEAVREAAQQPAPEVSGGFTSLVKQRAHFEVVDGISEPPPPPESAPEPGPFQT
ncbi:DUF3499 domain-containing protein [Scrofimicrobium sp. R131]|uniref:DUF3499 domain-containing protein n=1 Tax=Scrofimicrobium appendicitidis TaxID=3079930 RepID=A0AAU7V8X5_9ACTO